MEPRDIKTLFILEAIEKEECQSQRELSRNLNISLGLVNAFIKKLAFRGLFKIINLLFKHVRLYITLSAVRIFPSSTVIINIMQNGWSFHFFNLCFTLWAITSVIRGEFIFAA